MNLQTVETSPGLYVSIWGEPYPPFDIYFKAYWGEKCAGMKMSPYLFLTLKQEGCLERYLDFHMKRLLLHNTIRGF